MADDTNDSGREGRPLTSGEIAIMRSIPSIGDQIDYTQVLVFDSPQIDETTGAQAIGSNILFPEEHYHDDFSAAGVPEFAVGAFVHEMTHVWQDQIGMDIEDRVVDAINDIGGNGIELYDFIIRPDSEFLNFNPEQQAEIVNDFYRLSHGLPLSDLANPVTPPTFGDLLKILSFDEPPDPIDELLDAPIVEDTTRADPLRIDALLDAPVTGETVSSADGQPREPTVRPVQSDADLSDTLLDAPVTGEAAPSIPAQQPEPVIQPVNSPPSIPTSTVEAPENSAPSGSNDGEPATLGDLTGEAPASGDDVTPVTQDEPPSGFDDRSEDEIFDELEGVLKGEDTGQDDESEDDDEPEDTGEPETAGGGSATPNPVEDPVPGDGDPSDLTDRTAPATNPGPDASDSPTFHSGFSGIVERGDFAINTGDGSFDLEGVDGDVSDLFGLNNPAINTGAGDTGILQVGGDLTDLLDRNGNSQTDEAGGTDPADSTLGDSLLSGVEFDTALEDFSAFEIV